MDQSGADLLHHGIWLGRAPVETLAVLSGFDILDHFHNMRLCLSTDPVEWASSVKLVPISVNYALSECWLRKLFLILTGY